MTDGDRRRAGQLLGRALAHPRVPATGRLLELGCGTGEMLLWLARRGYEVAGVDIAPSAIMLARQRFASEGVQARLEIGTVCDLNRFDDGAFDLVVDGRCLHCVISTDRSAALRSVRRVLRPGGAFILDSMCNEPRAPDALAMFDTVSRYIMRDGVPTRYIGRPDDLIREVQLAGFDVAESWLEPPMDDLDQDELVLIAAG